jgi:hypothetical protein
MKSLLELIKELYGAKAISSTLGTRTNVVRFPGSKLDRYLKESLNIEAASDNAAINVYKEMEQLVPYTSKMNDSERLIFEGNLTRLRNKLQAADLLPKQKVVKEGEVVGMESKEKITGEELKKLTEEKGSKYSPTSIAGQLEAQGKRLEKAGEELKEIIPQQSESVIGDIVKDYIQFNNYMRNAQRTGYVRATVRQIMREDIQAGKLKLPKELQDQVMQGLGEPIDIYRKAYGEGALEQVDSLADNLGQFRTEEEAAKFVRSKYTIKPKAELVSESKTYEELEDIIKKGSDEPEGKADGGIIGYKNNVNNQSLGLDYLTGMEPPKEGYAGGGRIGYAEGSDGAPSITLDSYEKAPKNIDKYPIKAGNLELGIMGAMSSGKSTPDPYVKINTADRNFTVRGKYNVPNTGISLLGDIGDVRSRSRVNIDVPQYNYKETIKDVFRVNPYSVGIKYAPDQNRNINLRYDDRGNVFLRGEARFAKGGLGYLVGE